MSKLTDKLIKELINAAKDNLSVHEYNICDYDADRELDKARDALRDEIDRLTSRRAVKLCPSCERETEQEKYCEVWVCYECGKDNECEFEGVAQ